MNPSASLTPEAARQLAQLHASHGAEMERFAALKARCPDKGRDFAAAALAKMAPRIQTIAPGALPAYWQRAILNLIITQFRRDKTHPILSLDELTGGCAADERPDGALFQVAAPDAPVQSELEREITRAQVRAAVAALPRHQRETIVLFYFYGFSIREVARATGSVEGTVKSRLKRARDGLERRLIGL